MARKIVGGTSEVKQATEEVQKICDEVRYGRFCFYFDDESADQIARDTF